MIHPFYRTRLVYEVCSYIAQQRQEVLRELVAYTQDPVRHRRRMRMLQQLANYEQITLEKIQNFETNDQADLAHVDVIETLKQEVNSIVHKSA